MEKMEVSVIVPVYNVEKYLTECLESLLNQNFEKDFEIICINDGSTDGSSNILNKYSLHEKITVISQENQGLSKARNLGIKVAKGDFLMFIDSDDYLANRNVISVLYNEMLKEDLDFVAGAVQFSYPNPKKDFKVSYPQNLLNKAHIGSLLFESLMNKVDYLSIPCNKMYKKDFLSINNIFFYEGIIYEDVEFTVKCYFNAKKVKLLNEATFVYRQRENSITNNDILFKEKYKDYLFVAESLIELNNVYQSKAIIQLVLYLYVVLIKNRKQLKNLGIYEVSQSIKKNKIWWLFLKSNKLKYQLFGLINILRW